MRTIAIVILLAFLSAASSSQVNAAPGRCLGRRVTITGTGTFNGTSGNDVIVGSSGDDIIDGRGGNDVICGGPGNDQISEGNDVPSGAIVWFDGGSGNDTLTGPADAAEVHFTGGNGNDQLLGGVHGISGSEILSGGADDDLLIGGELESSNITVNSFFSGGSGDDELDAPDASSTLSDNTLTSTLRGDDGNDRLNLGGAWLSTITASLIGGNGDDHIDTGVSVGSTFDVKVDAGRGNDTVDSNPHDQSVVTLQVIGGDGNDTISGASIPNPADPSQTVTNTLRGGGGSDKLTGGDGVNTTNFIDGGGRPGNDTCVHGLDSTDRFRRCAVIV